MASQTETDAMRRALALARSVDLTRDSNPRVGAVVLSPTGRVIAEAAHRGAGTVHAESAALRDAGTAARGSTVVLTLEPCDHVGRTAACTDAIVAAGVRRVVFAQRDPNPEAAGGLESLRAAGVEVEAGVLESEARTLNRHWTFAMTHQRPFVTWKFAATLDGRSAAADGTSRWVSGPQARADVHRWRAGCDTILVGTGTVAVDNPRLTVRHGTDEPVARAAQPRRAVMGLRELDPQSHVLDAAAVTLLLRTRQPDQAVHTLFTAGSRHVWLEGGPTLGAAFLQAGLVDEVVAYVAPVLLGAGRPAVGDLGIRTIGEALRLQLDDVTRVGTDVRLTMRGPG
jgi:diaminohydroxyphosphoribosylaminopyrimidine deaminase/5-amino-6-(5-phosphoribosylamino)uracil reductase